VAKPRYLAAMCCSSVYLTLTYSCRIGIVKKKLQLNRAQGIQMTRFLTAVSVVAFLAACDNKQPLVFSNDQETTIENEGVVTDSEGEPILDENDEEIELTEEGIPEPIARNMVNANYDRNAGTLRVTIVGLDSTPLEAVYERNPALDLPGYVGFSVQEDPLDRFFVAYAQTSEDGNTIGTLTMDGGQFTTYIAGVHYTQNGYTPHVSSQPDNGLVAYTGNYVGILNIGDPDDSLLKVPTTTVPDELLPQQPFRVTGDVVINADFVDMRVNGGVANREARGTGGATFDLDEIGFVPAAILENGTFFGDVQRSDTSNIGNYAGTFGGPQASGIAAGVALTGDFVETVEGENEFGLIVLTKCGLPGDGQFCPDAQPDFDP